MHKFNPGDDFPSISGESLNYGTINLPRDMPAGEYSVVLAYRANW
ncbi:MAG: hypothetical protein O7G32_05430 [SAR324 cluster bacterium]|nr:hypothetical protein [SAR324 cluster bacterium]